MQYPPESKLQKLDAEGLFRQTPRGKAEPTSGRELKCEASLNEENATKTASGKKKSSQQISLKQLQENACSELSENKARGFINYDGVFIWSMPGKEE